MKRREFITLFGDAAVALRLTIVQNIQTDMASPCEIALVG
jgi:hypothetical protein